jgi:hypothetical protein
MFLARPHRLPRLPVPATLAAVSRSEAGQAKHLLVLDGAWRVVEEVPLDLGPRHFDAEAGEGLAQIAGSLRRGDRCEALCWAGFALSGRAPCGGCGRVKVGGLGKDMERELVASVAGFEAIAGQE